MLVTEAKTVYHVSADFTAYSRTVYVLSEAKPHLCVNSNVITAMVFSIPGYVLHILQRRQFYKCKGLAVNKSRRGKIKDDPNSHFDNKGMVLIAL